MNLDILFGAPLAIQLHLWAAVVAFGIGCANLMRAKGTASHKILGRVWVTLIAVVAISSFWIQEIDVWRGFSPIHLISIYVLVMLPLGIWHIRKGNVRGHRNAMVGVFVGGLVIAGLFTLAPGRLIARAFLGWE